MAIQFLLDSDVLVQAKNLHYRFEFCHGFWDWIGDAHTAGLLSSVQKVRAELVAGRRGDQARIWAEARPASFFLPDLGDALVMSHYGTLMTWAATSKHYSAPAIKQFADQSKADAFIIAAAKRWGAAVVTHEKANPEAKKRIPIPDAAAAIGVKTMTIFELLTKHASDTFKFKP